MAAPVPALTYRALPAIMKSGDATLMARMALVLKKRTVRGFIAQEKLHVVKGDLFYPANHLNGPAPDANIRKRIMMVVNKRIVAGFVSKNRLIGFPVPYLGGAVTTKTGQLHPPKTP